MPRVAYFCCAIKVPRGSRERQRGAEIVFKSANKKKKKGRNTSARYGFAVLIVSRTDRILGKYRGGFTRHMNRFVVSNVLVIYS